MEDCTAYGHMYTFVFNKNVADHVLCRGGKIPYCQWALPFQIQTLALCFVEFHQLSWVSL